MLTPQHLARLRESKRRQLTSEAERVKRLLIKLGAERIVLFGSAARGEIGIFSDVDMLAIMPSDLPFVERLQQIYGRIHPAGVDLFVYTPEEFEAIKESNPLVKQALKEGKTVYEKKP